MDGQTECWAIILSGASEIIFLTDRKKYQDEKKMFWLSNNNDSFFSTFQFNFSLTNFTVTYLTFLPSCQWNLKFNSNYNFSSKYKKGEKNTLEKNRLWKKETKQYPKCLHSVQHRIFMCMLKHTRKFVRFK